MNVDPQQLIMYENGPWAQIRPFRSVAKAHKGKMTLLETKKYVFGVSSHMCLMSESDNLT